MPICVYLFFYKYQNIPICNIGIYQNIPKKNLWELFGMCPTISD